MAQRIQLAIPFVIVTLVLVGIGYMFDSLPDASDKFALPEPQDANMADHYNVVYNNYTQN